MQSERMLLPKWAKVAATRLSDEQIANTGGTVHVATSPCDPLSLSEQSNDTDSSIAKSDLKSPGIHEPVAGTVSRKGKFGFAKENCCPWVPKKGGKPDYIKIRKWNPSRNKHGYVKTHTSIGLHFPRRCSKCASRMKRWTTAARNYDRLEILRVLEGRHCLRFLTLTRQEWNVKVDLHEIGVPNCSKPPLWVEAERIKKSAVQQFKNWRYRNKYWKSREAKGQAYYEVTMKPVWNGWGFDEVQLHFHIHMVVCSKRIENQDIQFDIDTLEEIPMSTTIQREWGGIVDVRKCRTWKHKDGEIKTSKRFVMNYLVDYINKSPHWQSTKFGDWSS